MYSVWNFWGFLVVSVFVLPFLFYSSLHLASFPHHIRYFVYVFPISGVDNSGSLRIGPCHTLSQNDISFCQMILCSLSWGKKCVATQHVQSFYSLDKCRPCAASCYDVVSSNSLLWASK